MIGWGIHESLLHADVLLADTTNLNHVCPDDRGRSYRTQFGEFLAAGMGKDRDLIERAVREGTTLADQLEALTSERRLAVVQEQRRELRKYDSLVNDPTYALSFGSEINAFCALKTIDRRCIESGFRATAYAINGEREPLRQFAQQVTGDAVPWLVADWSKPPSECDLAFVTLAYKLAHEGANVAAVSADNAILFLLQYGEFSFGKPKGSIVFSRSFNKGAGRPYATHLNRDFE